MLVVAVAMTTLPPLAPPPTGGRLGQVGGNDLEPVAVDDSPLRGLHGPRRRGLVGVFHVAKVLACGGAKLS